MPNPSHQSIQTHFRQVLGSIKRRLTGLASGHTSAVALALPIHHQIAVSDSSFFEPMMANILSGLGIIAGFTLGIVYRSMSESRESLRRKAATSDAELQAVLTMTDDAVLLLDHRAVIRGANPAAEELFGKSVDDLIGEELNRLIAHPLNLPELTRSGPANFRSTKAHSSENSPVEIVLSEVQLTKGASFLALVRDRNIGADSSEPAAPVPNYPDLSGPVSKFAHDLNNVLTGIIGNLSLILMTAPPDPVTSERITGAKRSAIKAQELNRKLLAIAKGENFDASDAATDSPMIVPIPSMMVSRPVSSVQQSSPEKKSENKGNPRVLVLDDEEAICALIATALGSLGYDVTEANDAEQAIKACEEAKKSGAPYELVISDLSLPGELSGEAAVKRMKEIHPELKAIVSSGYDSDPVMSKFRDHGFCAAISKPYDISKLGRVVTNALKADEEQPRKTA